MRGQQAARISKALLLQDQLVARKTKIVCTLGPSSWTEDGLAALLDAGMNVARFNFSHYAGGSHEAHQAVLDRLRKVAAARGCIVGCLLDTKGPEIRTAMLRGGKDIHLVAGQDIIVAAVGDRFREFEGYKDEQSGETKIGLSYAGLCAACKPGSHIVCSDGYVRIEVVRIISDTDLLGRVLTTHSLGQGVSCNLPGVKLVLPVLSASDIQDVQQFAARNQMDYIATSFVQSAADVRFVKQILHEAGGLQVKVIAKIENEAGLRDIDDIISVADGVMVARGDLAMEVPPERIALAQKLIIAKCNAAGKLVITATQMMESMVHHPMPTRAEMSDVANAVLDGTDAVMLSSESSLGLYPDATVRWMACIVEHAELGVDHEAMHARFDAASGTDAVPAVQRTLAQVMKQVLSRHNWGAGPAEKCRRCMIVVFSETGLAAELLAQCRPPCPVYVVSNSNAVLGGCTARHGLRPCRINTPLRDIRMASGDLVNHIRSLGVDLVGQAVIIVSGMACLCADQAPQMTVHHVARESACGRCSLDLGDQHWPTIFS